LGDLAKSPLSEYHGLPLVQFYDQPVGGSVVGKVRFKEGMKSPLFIFGPGSAKRGTKYSVYAIENDWSVHEANSYLLINLSSKQLYWQVGDQRFKLKARDKHAISVDGGQEKTPVLILGANAEGKPSRVYRAKWHNHPNLRRLVFVRDAGPDELGSVRVQIVEDYKPKAKPKPKKRKKKKKQQ
jgi:hypothetical protein